ncbi:EpsG family protein [Thalassobellus sediminis]|uniref:EpsG family protein n=1 Tax=Thalassobellus sediminis TaxID=3367753 RepID=UPI0037A09607
MEGYILENYHFIYHNFMLLVCLITFFHTLVLKGYENKVYNYNRIFGILIFLIILFFIGLRPINGKFVDMTTYAHTFNQYKYGLRDSIEGDAGFEYFVKFASQIMSIEVFFLMCTLIYTLPLYIASKKWFPNYHFFSFLMLISSFSFLTYGVNGMRNGMATSLFVLALAYGKKDRKKAILFLVISLLFHKSMLLLLFAYIITYIITDTKKYFLFWFLSILLSITMGGIWENLFAKLGFGGDRLSGYLTASADASKFSSTGFRYDFLLYSAAPLALAYFYIFKKGFKSDEYKHILHTYMIANSFWIMVIRANFSNRFAYLSWFLMALVVGYPLFKEVFWNNQFKKVGVITMIYYGFTYFMYYYYQYR